MRKNQWPAQLAAGALVTVTLLGAALASGQQGTQADPLVTLSYITSKVTPEIMTQVDAKVSAREKELTDRLNEAIAGYTREVDKKLAAASGGAGSSAAFSVVDMAAGQRLNAGIGCEVMLRIGAAACFGASSPALVDTTDGSALWDGNALIPNHLYMATIAGHGVTAKTAVKILVRGEYTMG